MAEHSEHYPTMIEHPRTKQRAAAANPLAHHRQLLAWKLPGLEPVPQAPVEEEPADTSEPGYPRMIEHEKTGQRVAVSSKAAHDAQLAAWGSKPAGKPAAAPASAKPSGKAAKNASGGPTLPTVADFIAKGMSEADAQKAADEEIRKFNAGEAPYGKE